jgi:uncharacterized protein
VPRGPCNTLASRAPTETYRLRPCVSRRLARASSNAEIEVTDPRADGETKSLPPCTDVHTIVAMEFEWDPQKAKANRRKHRVDFADAVTVLEDPLALTISDVVSGEERYVTLGLDAQARLLVVVYTETEHGFRIISARKANPHERQKYEG